MISFFSYWTSSVINIEVGQQKQKHFSLTVDNYCRWLESEYYGLTRYSTKRNLVFLFFGIHVIRFYTM